MKYASFASHLIPVASKAWSLLRPGFPSVPIGSACWQSSPLPFSVLLYAAMKRIRQGWSDGCRQLLLTLSLGVIAGE